MSQPLNWAQISAVDESARELSANFCCGWYGPLNWQKFSAAEEWRGYVCCGLATPWLESDYLLRINLLLKWEESGMRNESALELRRIICSAEEPNLELKNDLLWKSQSPLELRYIICCKWANPLNLKNYLLRMSRPVNADKPPLRAIFCCKIVIFCVAWRGTRSNDSFLSL